MWHSSVYVIGVYNCKQLRWARHEFDIKTKECDNETNAFSYLILISDTSWLDESFKTCCYPLKMNF